MIMLSIVEKRHCLAAKQSKPGSRKSDVRNENDEMHDFVIHDFLSTTMPSQVITETEPNQPISCFSYSGP